MCLSIFGNRHRVIDLQMKLKNLVTLRMLAAQ